jgi:large subunit ribosomal protein L14e
MMDIELSDIVVSLNGRDIGKRFFVVGKEDIYAMLADGKGRRIEKPKRKKQKHLRLEAKYECRTTVKIRNGEKVTNSEIRRALAEAISNGVGERGGM